MTNRLRILEIQFFERDVRFRLPFRFGTITLTEEPQVFARVRIQLESGQEAWGASAEVLGPKWFDKDPSLSNEQNMEQLRASLSVAAQMYLTDKSFDTPFVHFSKHYQPQLSHCGQLGLNPLIACYGPAILDRAILDALCRILKISFFGAMQANVAEIHATRLIPELSAFSFPHFLSGLEPNDWIHARHTVGLSDPISEVDQDKAIDDGLPETLEDVIGFYGSTYFKLKLSGRVNHDLRRLSSIAEVLDRIAEPYHVTLDGNEQYQEIGEVEELWSRIETARHLRRFHESVLFIEQPLNRHDALNQEVSRLSDKCPVIIDESDGDLDSFPRARYLGYRGVSSKQCKGIYKSIINSARCLIWNERVGEERFLMSGEDLTIQPGLSVQQDLALATLIGLTHLERNGHHYVRGMDGLSDSEQKAFLSAHPDLYTRDGGLVRIQIHGGKMQIRSLACPGFASAAEPDWRAMRQVSWFTA